MITKFAQTVLCIINNIPEGKVMTYGRIAAFAGQPTGARQVSRFLHSMSRKHDLPWHRVVNAKGKISLRPSRGYELQKALLESEGVQFSLKDAVNLDVYLWSPSAGNGLE